MLSVEPTPAGPAAVSRLARLVLLAGSITGYMVFMLLFAALGIGLVVMLIKDRKARP
jgi:hypothetical protein